MLCNENTAVLRYFFFFKYKNPRYSKNMILYHDNIIEIPARSQLFFIWGRNAKND